MVPRSDALQRDEADPLNRFVDEFVRPPGVIYLAGNSLGLLPRRTRRALDRSLADQWGARAVGAWDDWLDLAQRVGDRLGQAALGAAPGQVVVCDSTTVNLYKLIDAALRARPGSILTDTGNFPTDRYVVEGLAAQHHRAVVWAGPSAMDRSVGVVTLSMVDFRTSAVADVAGITQEAHAHGALAVWDLSHAVGVVPASLDAWGVDLAVGCSYKYLNGGPGAPAWLYVNRALQDELRPPIWGWFAHADQFAMPQGFVPATGITRWLTGTPNILGLDAVAEAVSLIEEAGIDRIHAKSQALVGYGASLLEVEAPPGGHLPVHHPDAKRMCERLVKAGVIVDFREPDIIRLGFSPLSTRFVDVWDGIAALRQL